MNIEDTSLVQLDCTAIGGVPDSHHITLVHSNQQIEATVGSHLQTYIANNLFGEFICIIESLHDTKQTSLLLQERGNM